MGWTLYQEGVSRGILSKVKGYLELPHIIALVGVRRSGKSTLVRQTINHLVRDKGTPPGTYSSLISKTHNSAATVAMFLTLNELMTII